MMGPRLLFAGTDKNGKSSSLPNFPKYSHTSPLCREMQSAAYRSSSLTAQTLASMILQTGSMASLVSRLAAASL